jgi:hypothetical protein
VQANWNFFFKEAGSLISTVSLPPQKSSSKIQHPLQFKNYKSLARTFRHLPELSDLPKLQVQVAGTCQNLFIKNTSQQIFGLESGNDMELERCS